LALAAKRPTVFLLPWSGTPPGPAIAFVNASSMSEVDLSAIEPSLAVPAKCHPSPYPLPFFRGEGRVRGARILPSTSVLLCEDSQTMQDQQKNAWCSDSAPLLRGAQRV